MAANVSVSPAGPKSAPWLLAIVATSTPAALSAVNAAAGARNVNCFGSAAPPSVIAVSRLTMARSARDSTVPTGPSVVAGSAASRSETRPSKCTSPAKARVICGAGVGSGVPVGALLPVELPPVAPLPGEAPRVGRAAGWIDRATVATPATTTPTVTMATNAVTSRAPRRGASPPVDCTRGPYRRTPRSRASRTLPTAWGVSFCYVSASPSEAEA